MAKLSKTGKLSVALIFGGAILSTSFNLIAIKGYSKDIKLLKQYTNCLQETSICNPLETSQFKKAYEDNKKKDNGDNIASNIGGFGFWAMVTGVGLGIRESKKIKVKTVNLS